MLFLLFFPCADAEPAATAEPGIISPQFENVDPNLVDLATEGTTTAHPHVDYAEVETSSEVETKVSPPEGIQTELYRTATNHPHS
jgi:hypothetical protein